MSSGEDDTPSPRIQVDRDDVIDSAIRLLYEQGFKGVTMRSVAHRLGVSPIPLYTKVGDKNALITAMAERLLGDIEVSFEAGSTWPEQAEQWARTYRERLKAIPDRHLILNNQSREVFIRATSSLLIGLRSAGLSREQAVRICRMLMWVTTGFVILESGAEKLDAHFDPVEHGSVPGGQAEGVTQSELDDLFGAQIRFIIGGLHHEVDSGSPVAAGGRRGASNF